MGRKIANPSEYIASVRLNREEWEGLSLLSTTLGVTRSAFLRLILAHSFENIKIK